MPRDGPIVINAYSTPASSGPRLFSSAQKRVSKSEVQKEDSGLLKSIRAAFQGSGKEPDPPFRSTTSPTIDGHDAEEDLTWDGTTVTYSAGGVLRQTWNFEEEGQRVQYACFGWLLTEGTVHASSGSGSARFGLDASENDVPTTVHSEQKPERDTFGAFFRAQKARMRSVEPTTLARGVYVFLRSFGRLFLMNGLEYSFSLPFVVHRAWPLSPHGVLLQRVVELAEHDEPDPLPSLYTLTNPFQEPRPVGLTERIKGGHGFGPKPEHAHAPPGILTKEFEGIPRNIHAEEQVVWIAPRNADTTDADNLIATLDGDKKRLSIWRYVYVAPKALPSPAPSPPLLASAPRTGPPLPGDKPHVQMRTTSQAGKDMIARSDRIRAPSPDFEPAQAAEFVEMPPLSAMPGMAPTLSSTTTLASLASVGAGVGSTRAQAQWPASSSHGRKTSSTRNDLTSTLDRMVLGRRSEVHSQAVSPVVNQSILPVYWVERLYEYRLDEEDSKAWANMTFAVYDQRIDETHHRSHVAFCLPASRQVIRLVLSPDPEDNTLKLTFLSTLQFVRSIAAVKCTRPYIWDLLILRSDATLSVLTIEDMEIPLDVNFTGLEGKETTILDASMTDARYDVDVSLSAPGVIETDPKIVALQDPLVSTVRLVLEDGRVARLATDFSPTDELVSHVVLTLSIYCKRDDYLKIFKAFLHAWNKKNRSAQPGVQFDCIAEALLGNWGIEWYSTECPPPGSDASSSPWATLMTSTSHFRLRDEPALMSIVPPVVPPPRLQTLSHRTITRSDRVTIHYILIGLHLLGEELRMLVHKHESLLRLSTLTLRLTQLVRPGFSDLLKRLYPSSASGWMIGVDMTQKGDIILPLDISAAIYSRLASPEHKSTLLESTANHGNISNAYGKFSTHSVMLEFTQLFNTFSDIKQPDARKRAEATVLMMVQRQFGLDYLNLLPLAFSAPLREAARICQLAPPPNWPVSAYEFVGRSDLTESGKVYGDFTFNDGYRSIKDHLKKGLIRRSFHETFKEVHMAIHHNDESVTGVELEMADFTEVRFGQDRRMQEVARMLRSSNIPSIRMADRPDLNEHDFAKEQQMQVLRTTERTLALPIGRAMFTFATVQTVSREMYTVPKIELSIRIQPQNICIGPEPGKISSDAISWAEFHNGVAAALRISPATGAIDSSWISFNKPNDLTAEHAGFLFGLGLTGHLKEMLTWHTFGYLTPKHELTSIGVLLGLAAANVGSRNKHVTKLLAVHTPALLSSPDVDLNVPLTTQAAGLVGVGLLYMGSKNRRMAEVALHQISRPDLLQPDLNNENREAYTVSAALSFGMIMLGRGAATTSPADVAILSRLRILIHGEGPSVFQPKQHEPSFDVNITSPAATMALGLMYLRTDRQDVADILTIPDSVASLNHIQPNFLLVRTIARNLIMWNTIKPTKEWLLKQVPESIMRIMETRLPYQTVDDAIELAYYHITSGAVFSLALKYAGTASQQAYSIIAEFYEFFRRSSWHTSPAFDHRIKKAATRDGLNLVTLAMGIVMVGTGELSCLKRLRLAHGMYSQPVRYGSHMATHMALGLLFLGEGRFSLGSSDAAIACIVASFYPHFPALSSDNKGYLPALRHLWVLAVEPRCLVARDVDSKEVVYLPMKIKVKEENGTSSIAQLIAPTLIPGLDRLLSIKIDTPRYWPFLLDIANNTRHMGGLLQSQTLFVKRRTMFLSYMEDPKGSRSLFVRSGMSTGDAAMLDCPQLTDTNAHPASDIQHYITSHSNDVSFIAFADRLCRADGSTEDEKIFNRFCHAALLDCIIQDKPQILSSYLALYRARIMSPRSRYFQLVQQDILRVDAFYSKLFDRRYSGRPDGIRPTLLRENAVSGVVLAVDAKLRTVTQEPSFKRALRAYVQNQSTSEHLCSNEENPDVERDLAWYLQRHAVPYSSYFPVVQQLAVETLAKYEPEPPPPGASDADKLKGLEQAVKLMLHASVTGLVRPFGSWTINSFNDVLQIWQTS